MKLNDTNQFIKDSFQDIIDGKFNDKFSPEQIKMMLEMSFLYNHITFEFDAIVFEYNDFKLKFKLKLSNINDIIHSMPMQIGEDEILSMIKNESVFKSCYRSFLRDIKIDGILS
jgi:hypothetical protein